MIGDVLTVERNLCFGTVYHPVYHSVCIRTLSLPISWRFDFRTGLRNHNDFQRLPAISARFKMINYSALFFGPTKSHPTISKDP